MAGSYPDAPGRRMAWDADGSIAFWCRQDQEGSYELDQAKMTEANDEDQFTFGWPVNSTQNIWRQAHWAGVIFPELRDVFGYFCTQSVATGTSLAAEYSTDTTNGFDGTWAATTSWNGDGTTAPVRPYYRTEIVTVSLSAVRAVRFYSAETGASFDDAHHWNAMHLYGEISSGYTPDRLLYINNTTGLEYTGPIDWGDIPRGAVYDEEWYIKNNSSTLAAVNTTISRESLYLNSHLFYTFSTGVGFADTLGPVASITAGSRWPPSNALTIRNDPPSTASLGLHAARIVLDTSSWS